MNDELKEFLTGDNWEAKPAEDLTFKFKPSVNHIFSCSQLPIVDPSDGFSRRWVTEKNKETKMNNQFDEYQKQAKKTAIYPKDRALEYTALGLVSEVGEIAGKVKKVIRDQGGVFTDVTRAQIGAEMGDVLWYVAMCADALGEDLSDEQACVPHTTFDGYQDQWIFVSYDKGSALRLAIVTGVYASAVDDHEDLRGIEGMEERRESALRDCMVTLCDVLEELGALCNTLGVRLADIAQGNLDKLASRAARNKIGGSGDER